MDRCGVKKEASNHYLLSEVSASNSCANLLPMGLEECFAHVLRSILSWIFKGLLSLMAC